MKLKAPVFLVLFFLSQAALAQVLIGPTVGPQVSWMSFGDRDYKDSLSVSPHVGFHAGFNLSFRVRKRFFLHTSLVYSTKGSTIKGKKGVDAGTGLGFNKEDLKDKVRYNYIELPIMYTYEIKMHAGPNKEFKWYFGVGPNISYWLGGKGEMKDAYTNEQRISEPLEYKIVFNKNPDEAPQGELVVNSPNRIQLGLNFSGGFVFEPLGYQKIMLTIRYELGHSYLSKNLGILPGDLDYFPVMRSRNNGLRFSLAYLIDLKTEDRKKGKSTIKKKKLR